MPKWDKEQFVKDYEELKSAIKMAKRYNSSKNTVLKFAKEIGYVNHYRPELTEEQKEYIVSCYETKTAPNLAKELSVSSSLIQKIWMENGKRGKRIYQYYYDKNFFHDIDTSEKAYFLGLLSADGCVYNRNKKGFQNWVKLALQSCDEKVLKLFLQCLNSDKPVNHTVKHGKNVDTNVSSVEIVSDEMAEDLKQWNIVPRKTYDFITPNIPKHLYSHYFRGYFDGDGSIFFRNNILLPSQCDISISGFEQNLGKMISILKDFDINASFLKDKRKEKENKKEYSFGRITFSSIKDKYYFLKYMYQDCQNLFIDRKKEKVDCFFEIIDKNIGNKQNLYEKIKQQCRFQ